jgi:hypothetical protein
MKRITERLNDAAKKIQSQFKTPSTRCSHCGPENPSIENTTKITIKRMKTIPSE